MVIPIRLHAPEGQRPIVFRWAVSSVSGWGIYGLNLALHLSADPRYMPVSTAPWFDVSVDPVRAHGMAAFRQASRALGETLERVTDPVVMNAPVLHAMNDDLVRDRYTHGGTPDFGVIFMTDTRITRDGKARAGQLRRIVAGSSWNASVLHAAGIDHVDTVLQGVDPALFHPAPPSGLLAGRFTIFSGGKIEFRKGQDLVMAAFRAFHARHPEALLLTAWQSPWPGLASSLARPPPATRDGMIDVAEWAMSHGLPAGSVFDTGKLPNAMMPLVIREADAAIFASRAEGGTNLVAMEAMACGVPTILSANTGHLDLLSDGAAMPLLRQRPVALDGAGTDGWGESDVEEMLEALETLWTNRDQARLLGARGAAAMARLPWRTQIAALMAAIEPFFD